MNKKLTATKISTPVVANYFKQGDIKQVMCFFKSLKKKRHELFYITLISKITLT